MYKHTLLAICLASLLSTVAPLKAQDSTTFVEVESHSIFKGLFQSVWTRLKALNPASSESANAEVTYTAGVRGAESTDTLLQPYWKNDLSRDSAFQEELAQFSQAQSQMDRGELARAIESFDRFLERFAYSDLRPNALFGKSISHAGLGNNDQSLATMRQFVEENPRHPLYEDARSVIDELQ